LTEEEAMKFLCLAYGDEKDWHALSEAEQEELLAQDEVLRQRGDLVAAVGEAAIVRAWDGTPSTTTGTVAESPIPLAGFSVLEARDLDEAIQLIAYTPCARAKGAVEVRPILEM
jgi:hypothetical protein